jgi:NADH:ubiquinone oxidoreductase subunit D
MISLPSDLPQSGQVELTLGAIGSDIEIPAIHPLGQGQLRLHLSLKAGAVQDLAVRFGNGHRGDEKLLEVRDFRQGLSLTNRHNWLSPISAEVAYARACEDLMGLTPPARAQVLRELVIQLQCATGWLQLIAGVEHATVWLSLRERLVELTDSLTGARLHVSFVRLGGVAHDVRADELESAQATVAQLSWPADSDPVLLDHVTRHLAEFLRLCAVAVATPGPVAVALPKVVRVPVGQSYAETIGTTGTVGVWLHSDGGKTPLRVALKAPSLSNLSAWQRESIGKSLDVSLSQLLRLPLCYGELER